MFLDFEKKVKKRKKRTGMPTRRPLNRSNFTITLNFEAFVILLRLIDPINQIVQQRLRPRATSQNGSTSRS